MTRMVDERRGQIGILKGLGYSGRDIMMTFMLYSGTAAILGCIIGYAIGVVLFPAVIWFAYEMMYNSIPIRFLTNWKLATIVFIVSLASTLGTTYISCRSEMSESAASLLRPKAPKAGKRVFLEYIPAVWSRMKFMHKVSVRNIFRYKKRFFMMVVGISGCTALLLTGFGLKDSIATFVDSQYEEIQVAKAELLMEETEGDSLPEDLTKTLKELDATCFPYQQTSWDLQLEDRVKGVTVIVPQKKYRKPDPARRSSASVFQGATICPSAIRFDSEMKICRRSRRRWPGYLRTMSTTMCFYPKRP